MWGPGGNEKHSAMETQFKELRNGAPDVLDLKNAPTTGGGVGDTFGEDAATEEQTLTPWSRVVAR
jgi:malate dehydrogenase (oxaloacetate-decarboxylating)(NADP+)